MSSRSLILIFSLALISTTLIAGLSYGLAPSVLLQVGGGDGFISDVDTSNEDADIRVIDLEVAKTTVASQNEIEVEAIVANYGTETKQDVTIKPKLLNMDGSSANSDQFNLRPQDEYVVDEFEPGEIKTFTFFAEFEQSPTDQGVNELNYRLQLSDTDGNTVNNIKPAERIITVVKKGSSTSGSSFIDRSAISSSTFSVDSYKDEQISQTDVVGGDMSIPPVEKDEEGNIAERDVAEGQVTSFGAITQLDTRSSGEISTDDGKLQVGFGFRSIPSKQHYLFRIAHQETDIPEPVELKVVGATGDEIDRNTSYKVPEAEGQVEQFDFHLSEKEVDYIKGQGEAFIVTNITTDGGTNNVDIGSLYYMSLIGVNEIVNLPESNIKIQSIEPVDGNHVIETQDGQDRPVYDPDDQMEFEVEIKNKGSASYTGELSLIEMRKDFASNRDSKPRQVINPGETRRFTFSTLADEPGTHEYTLNGRSLCDESLTEGTECPLLVDVTGGPDEIVPRINPESPIIVAEETSQFNLDGVFSDDYDRINSITWSFDGDESSYTAENGVQVQHTFNTEGQKTVTAEVEYELDGQTETAEHQVYVDVVERPQPEINAVYYDVKTTDRSTTRSGQSWGTGIGGQIMSNSCSNTCDGEINIGNINPQMTEGVGMMVVDKNFQQNSPEIVHYGTYNFETDQYATNGGSEFDGDLSNHLSSGASTRFQQDVSTYSQKGNILIFVGGGNPASTTVETELSSMGAELTGSGEPEQHSAYSFITEVTDGSNYVPLHESYLPNSSQDPLRHSIEIVPVEATDSNVPADREVYFEVEDANGSDYYENLDDSQISYDWTGVSDEGSYGYTTSSSDISVSVDLTLNTISDADQTASETVSVSNLDPVASARRSIGIIEEGEETAITASYSHDPDGKIEESRYEWSVSAPDGTQFIPSADGQSFTVEAGGTPGPVEAQLIIDGEHTDTTTLQVASDINAEFGVDRVSGMIDYERDQVSPEENIIYSYGEDVGQTSIQELDLNSITTDVQGTFGAGIVNFRDNYILLQADGRVAGSASRFVQTDPINLGLYDSVYVSYEREFRRGTDAGNPETGYVSMHLGNITEEQYTYGEKATLRGSNTDIAMTSDVVTQDAVNKRYNVMKLDVSDVTREESVKIHARAHSSNDGLTEMRIHEVWAGSSDSLGDTSQLFSNNVYPDTTDNVQYTRTRLGLNIVDLGAGQSTISTRSSSSQNAEVSYNVVGEASSNYQITTNGNDITTDLNEDTVSVENPGSQFQISATSEMTKPFVIDTFRANLDRSNTENPVVRLDGSDAAALEGDEYRWTASNPEVVDIRNNNDRITTAEFEQTGEHEITLTVDGRLGSDTHTETIQVDSIAPEINLDVPSSSQLGSNVPVSVELVNDADVQEILVLFGDGDKQVLTSSGTVEHLYDNPGQYEVTAIAKTPNGLTTAQSSEIVVDAIGVSVPDSTEEEVVLPNNAYFDATNSLGGQVPDESQPATIIQLDDLIDNEDSMNYTWDTQDGQFTGETFLYETNSEGTDTINLEVESPNGQTDNMEITLNKVAVEPEVTQISTDKESVYFDESLNVTYTVDHREGIDSTFEILPGDGNLYTSAFTGSTQSTRELEIYTENREPGDLPDTYNIEGIVEDQYGKNDSATTQIEVLPGPTAVFEFVDQQPYVIGESVEIDGSESDEPYGEQLTYQWEFPSGTVTNQGDPSVTHSFSYADEVDVTLTITDANGDSDSVTKTTTVNPVPVASFDATSVESTAQSEIYEFDASASDVGGQDNSISEYRYDFNSDGTFDTVSETPVVQHEYAEPDTYNVTLQIVDQYGYTDTTSTEITVNRAFDDPVRITTCGNQQARLGPSQDDCDTEYAGTDLEGINVYGNGIQEVEALAGGYYEIEAVGAGYSDGYGAQMQGIVNIQEDTNLQIAVGQQGSNNGGAGGTFVATGSDYSSANPLIVAGGGGSAYNGDSNANTGTAGNYGESSGGTNGQGGSGSDGTGGGGFYSDGGGGQATNQGGYAFQNGAMGSGANVNNAYGGFGGGGAPEDGGDEPAGAGGYSGGGGANDCDCDNDGDYEDPGGGGSYIADEFESSTSSVGNSGAGYVEIRYVGSTLPESCQDIQQNGIDTSGEYEIYHNGQQISVYCDMDTDGGGWTRINASTADSMVDVVGGGFEAKGNVDQTGFDGAKPWAISSSNPGGGFEYDINTGFTFSQMYLENVGFKSTSYKVDNDDTSDIQYSNYVMDSWEYYGGGPNGHKGDIGFGVPTGVGPTTTYADLDVSFNSNSGVVEYPSNLEDGGQIFDISTSDSTLRIATSESGGQSEGWRWDRGSIYVR